MPKPYTNGYLTMKNNVTPMVEGGLLVAIAVVLGLMSVYIPILGILVEFFCAVPITVLTVRQGVGKGVMALAVSFVLLAMFIGPLLAARIALSFGVCGLVLGVCINRNFDAARTFIMTLVSAFVAQVIAVGILSFVMGISVIDDEVAMMRESFEESFALYESMGVDQRAIDEAKAQVAPTLELMSHLLPTILMIMALFNAIACYLTSKWIFQKIRLKFVEPLPPFAQWRFPSAFLYIASFAILGLYWGGTRHWDVLYTISLNLTFFAMSFGLIQGFSILSFVADKYNVSKFMRRVLFVLLILSMLTVQIIAITGLFDMIFDYRRKFLN